MVIDVIDVLVAEKWIEQKSKLTRFGTTRVAFA